LNKRGRHVYSDRISFPIGLHHTFCWRTIVTSAFQQHK